MYIAIFFLINICLLNVLLKIVLKPKKFKIISFFCHKIKIISLIPFVQPVDYILLPFVLLSCNGCITLVVDWVFLNANSRIDKALTQYRVAFRHFISGTVAFCSVASLAAAFRLCTAKRSYFT